MKQQDNSRNLILFIIIAALILLVWNYLFPPPPPATTLPENQTQVVANQTVESEKLSTSRLISVQTDMLNLHIDEASGDIRDLSFVKQIQPKMRINPLFYLKIPRKILTLHKAV